MKTGNESGSVVTLEEAKEYTHSFQQHHPDAIKSYLVSVNKLNLILAQENCSDIRIYNGYDSEKKQRNVVLVGVDDQGKDMTEGIILEKFVTCPSMCPIQSPLMKVIP